MLLRPLSIRLVDVSAVARRAIRLYGNLADVSDRTQTANSTRHRRSRPIACIDQKRLQQAEIANWKRL
jgi:hypothetical protein